MDRGAQWATLYTLHSTVTKMSDTAYLSIPLTAHQVLLVVCGILVP